MRSGRSCLGDGCVRVPPVDARRGDQHPRLIAQFVRTTSGGRIVSYPEPRYLGEGGDVSAGYRPADTKPDLSSPSGNTHYLATHVLTGGEFGLYKIDLAPQAPGPSSHFHRSISESFFVLAGEVQLFDGEQWITARRDDILYVPVGGLHAFRNGSEAAASMLLLFSPGAHHQPDPKAPERDGTEQPPTTASRLAITASLYSARPCARPTFRESRAECRLDGVPNPGSGRSAPPPGWLNGGTVTEHSSPSITTRSGKLSEQLHACGELLQHDHETSV